MWFTIQPIAWVLFLCLFCPTVFAGHSQLSIDSTGNIEGLPEEFTPTALVVRAAQGRDEVTLTLKNHVVHLPACIADLFALPDNEEPLIFASWLHERGELPPYILFVMERLESEGDTNYDSFWVWFHLPTAELIEVRMVEVGTAWFENPVKDLSSLCTQAELRNLSQYPKSSPDELSRKDRMTDHVEEASQHLNNKGGPMWSTIEAYWLLGAVLIGLLLVVAHRKEIG